MSECDITHLIKRKKYIRESIEWSENDIFQLVLLYKKFPCLWKKDLPDYADKLKRHCAYRSIHEAVNVANVTFTDVIMKIREIRRAYVNELKKALIARSSGSIYRFRSPWFVIMHEFLHPHLDYDESVNLSWENPFKNQCDYSGIKELPVDIYQLKKSQISDWQDLESSDLYNYQYDIVSPFLNNSASEEESSSTIVREKISNSTCMDNDKNNVTECGVQWIESSDSKKSFLPVSCEASSIGKETKESAVAVEYDTYDIFAENIASHLRAMDVETALRAQDQIRKVITDHRLRKPETQSIRLLRPEVSGRDGNRKSLPPATKTHYTVQHLQFKPRTVAASCTIRKTFLTHRNRDIQDSALTRNNRELKSKAKKPTKSIIEPIITHYELCKSPRKSIKSTPANRSISLGGDTDTIGSMAGAIAGAFYGEELIKPEILKHCEFSTEFRELADQLFDIANV